MEKTLISKSLNEIFYTIPHLIKFPSKRFWVDYDEKADVVYISLNRPQNATDSKMLDNGILLRYRNKTLVGITILEASKRQSKL